MNHDDSNPNLTPLNDPEIEARIVAWVAGEASAFEIAELTRLIEEKPELAIFKRRIETVHGLVGEAVRPDQTPLRLSEARRSRLLQVLEGGETKPSEATQSKPIAADFTTVVRKNRKDRQWMLAVAACMAIGLFTFLSIPRFNAFREVEVKPAPAVQAMQMKREKTGRLAEDDVKKQESTVRVELPVAPLAVDLTENAALAEAPSKNLRQTRIAGLDQQNNRQFDGGESNTSMNSFQTFAAQAAPKSTGPTATSPEAVPVARNYISSDGLKLKAAASFAPGMPEKLPEQAASSHSEGSLRKQRDDQRGLNEQRERVLQAAPQSDKFGFAVDRLTGEPAQNATAADEEKVLLSPFSIAGKKESAGYMPQNTLAGSRLKTDLKDAGSAISVVTKEFTAGVGAENGKQSASVSRGVAQSPATESDSFRANLAQSVGQLAANQPGSAQGSAEALSDKKADDDQPLPPPPKPETIAAPVEVKASKESVSTFSLHVSDVSFRLAQAALTANEPIDPARIRPEEFYNAFSYGDPTPSIAEKVSCRIEQAAHPFLQQRNLVRIALKVAASGRDAAQPLHLTVLLDHSGSMEREDRMATVRSAMQSLVSLLGPNDRITLIGFARQPNLLAESLTGDQAAQLLDLIARTPAEGGTNLEEALKLGSELARRQFEPTAQNRIVLLTDGAANLGNANPEQLAHAIETLRQQGIAFDACGVGLEGLDDMMLESLTRKGDGRYYVLNSPEAADAGFAHQLAGAFRPAAENVKLQVRFNPARVGNYRLIGFEHHRLREEDFRNDAVDAAELAAEEAAVAVYQVETLPQGEGEIGEVYVRFRDASSGSMVERSWTLSYDAQAPAFERATPSMQLAGTAALLAEKLRGGQSGDSIRLGELASVVNHLRSHYAHETRVQDLAGMYEQARRRFGD